ncbi:acetylornithine deacetylase [Idiomarina seosinensis]|uniref:Acetylornithine deacetylase n=1 Tax=Idiomarina seosinensis TaxID=281739 RepID=A0A432ZBR1_9GAMM|nr:acetylornithine deacetylase [Idiomarina seosinensis]RUO75361.1 acetylornithine deacetylase [Idiomarina seosinensis]
MPVPSFFSMYQQLIAIPSISSMDSQWDHSNKAVIEKLAEWLGELGFDCEINELQGKPGKFNLLARRGTGSGGLLLSGHTDTVPYDESRWSSDPFTLTERDNRWYGLGSIDMKGFFAFVIEALKELPAEQQQQPLMILATADEETTMDGARQLSNFSNLKPDACIIGEPTSMTPVLAHKGHLSEAIRVTGKSGHSSDPKLGLNAIEIMHQVIGRLLTVQSDFSSKYSNALFTVPEPTLNFGSIHGGDNPNRICGCCELQIDIRPLPGMDISELYLLINQQLADLRQRCPGQIDLIQLHPAIPGYQEQADAALVHLAEKISGRTAHAVNYCTEAPFIQQLGCETVVMGPGSIAQAHQPDEYLATDTIDSTQKQIYQLIRGYCY